MRLNELAGKRKAEAEGSFAPYPRFLDPVEAVEHAWEILLGNAGSIVADLDDRALVVAYWFQELQDEKQPNVSGAQVNKELKHLGHGVRDITKVFSALIATSPQQVIQTRKSGTSRQARKSYKVTKAGIKRVQELLDAAS